MPAMAMRVSKNCVVKPGPQRRRNMMTAMAMRVSKNYAVIPGPQSEETEHDDSHGSEGK